MNEQHPIDFTSQPPPAGKGSTQNGGGIRAVELLTYAGFIPSLYALHAVQGIWQRVDQYTPQEQLAVSGRAKDSFVQKGNEPQDVGDDATNRNDVGDENVVSLKSQGELGALDGDMPLYLFVEVREFPKGVAGLNTVEGVRPAAFIDLNVADMLATFDQATKQHGGNPLEGYRAILAGPCHMFGMNLDSTIAAILNKAIPAFNAELMAAIPGAKA